MRKIALALSLLCAVAFTGCAAGPHQISRSVDDWDRELYVESPWLDAALYVVPVIPLLRFGSAFADFFGDGYVFWFHDAFSGENGTGFRHLDVEANRSQGSLLGDGSFWKIDEN